MGLNTKEMRDKATDKSERLSWNHPFGTEKDICDHFEEYVDKLLEITKEIEPELKRQIKSLNYSKSVKHEKWRQGYWANVFLSPAVTSAADISEKLLETGKYQDAFWVSNIFGEICKVLADRNRARYQEVFERLATVACCTVGEYTFRRLIPFPPGEDEAEIEILRKQIEGICLRGALGTFYHNKKKKYLRKRAGGADLVLAKQIINDSLAWNFDKTLRYLIEFERHQVRTYAWRNIPVVCGLELSSRWAGKRKEWKELLKSEGYQDLLDDLKGIGVLINPEEVGKISEAQMEALKLAERENDYNRVKELLTESASALRDLLYWEAQARLDYLAPPVPWIKEKKLAKKFERVPVFTRIGSPEDLDRAIKITKKVWEKDIDNLMLQAWLAYLYAKSNRLEAAEQNFESIRKRFEAGEINFVIDWNLAVLACEQNDEKRSYKLLLSLLGREEADINLVRILFALSHKLGDRKRFLSFLPLTMSHQFLPLAFIAAHELEDELSQKWILAKISGSSHWQLPPVDMEFWDTDFKSIVNKAIVEGQLDQLIPWIRGHIKRNPRSLTPYTELARVLEDHFKDIDGAFAVLRERLNKQLAKDPKQRFIDMACRDLLDLCKRNNRMELGQKTYKLAEKLRVSPHLLRPFNEFAPGLTGEPKELVRETPVELEDLMIPKPYLLTEPGLPERLAWVTVNLAKIQTTAVYTKEKQEIEEFTKILTIMNPHESKVAVELIKDITRGIDLFSKNDNLYTRRALFDKAVGYEKRLTELGADFENNSMLKWLSHVLTPYLGALKYVIGDMSNQVGIIPSILAKIENSFISLESVRTTLAIGITNQSERPISNIVVDLSSGTPVVSIAHDHVQKIERLGSLECKPLYFSIEPKDTITDAVKELIFNASIRFSCEGFKDIDLDIKQLRVPVRRFSQVVKHGQIIKFFQVGQSLRPSSPNQVLFQGRDDVLNKIKGSFSGGVQNERYFLDGIRRIGKTSIINFLPIFLPWNIIPVFIDFDLHSMGVRGQVDSAAVIQNFCLQIRNKCLEYENIELAVPSPDHFKKDAGKAFQDFLALFNQSLPDKTPLIIIDEFQVLLHAISCSCTGPGSLQDTLVLDQLRALMGKGNLYMICTGSVRFDSLSNIVQHRIFDSLIPLPISFLSYKSVGEVLKAGFEEPVKIPEETIKNIYELSGGYPWLVQAYGSALVDLLNEEHRIEAAPFDVERITRHSILINSQNFEFWWPLSQMGIHEERFIERLFRDYPDKDTVSIKDYFSGIGTREKAAYMKAFQNLRSCEVLDSTLENTLRFRGSVLKQWLQTQMQIDNRLRIRVYKEEKTATQGKTGMFIDHENLMKSLESISRAQGITVPDGQDKVQWLAGILKRLLEEAKRRTGDVNYKITVAFWNYPAEAQLLSAYFINGFSPQQPENVKMKNAVDFKLADEVRRIQHQASLENSILGKVIIVSGDGDYVHMVRTLVNEGVDVQIWGGSYAINQNYTKIIGEKNIVAIDDVCGLG